MTLNVHAIRAIYVFEMSRTFRTLFQSIVSPVMSTSLYFVVFGSAIGSRMTSVQGVSYGAFIVPGLILLALLTESISNASFGIYFPKFTGTIYEILSAPISSFEIVIGYVGAAATKSILIGSIIMATASLFVPLQVLHPFWMVFFLALTSVTFSLFGFLIGIWADGFEKLQFIPMLVVTPLTFLGGSFYSIDMLPPFWRTLTLFNPVVYLVGGFRWSFYGVSDVMWIWPARRRKHRAFPPSHRESARSTKRTQPKLAACSTTASPNATPALFALAHSAVTGLHPAGPEHRERIPIRPRLGRPACSSQTFGTRFASCRLEVGSAHESDRFEPPGGADQVPAPTRGIAGHHRRSAAFDGVPEKVQSPARGEQPDRDG
jgi:ABC-2 type transport system permease protein